MHGMYINAILPINIVHKTDANHSQAYRLYTLAKFGKPEAGAMNRLRQSKIISSLLPPIYWRRKHANQENRR